jgi:hypothetical protein
MVGNRLQGLVRNIRHRISVYSKTFGSMETFLITIFFGFGVATLVLSRHTPKPLPLLVPGLFFGVALLVASSPILFPMWKEK